MANKPALMEIEKPSLARGYSPTLGWYLGSRWFVMMALTLFALGSFIYLIDLIEMLRSTSGHNVSALTAALMSLMKFPDLLMQMLPFASLLASLVWLNQLNKRQELVALRAAGLPARRFIMGPLIACLMVGLTALFIINPIAASLLKRYEAVRSDIFPDTVRGLVTSGGGIWLRQEDSFHGERMSFFIYGRSVSANGSNLGKATVFVFDSKGDFVARLDADRAELLDGKWRLENVFMLSPRQKVVHEEAVALPTRLTPEQIQSSFNPPGTLNLWELRRFIDVLQASGLPASRHAMAYQRLLALPVLGITMLLLAVPFGLRFTRGRGLATVILSGLGLGFGFFLFGNFVSAYGLAGRLDVVLAAWLPSMMAILLAAALLIHLREE